MKNLRLYLVLFVLLAVNANAQQIAKSVDATGDSTYLPQITLVADPSCYGPYTINTQHTNIYLLNELPENTSKVIMQYIDSKGKLLGESHVEEGVNIEDVVWIVESEDVGFALSPNLNIEIHYNDSVAIYNIPYIVYPDAVQFFATAGWGSFVSNNYPVADDWQPVPALSNTFTVKNLPPRTDTLEFQILAVDSTVIKSFWVYAPQGEYLDSAVFSNVRMDSLPLTSRILRTLIWCEGGPEEGLEFHKELTIIPQQPKLISKSEGTTLIDSIGTFVENQFTGQALGISKIKYASISNGPGVRDKTKDNETIYRGPYSFDIFIEDYSIESWLKFDLEKLQNANDAGMVFMSVDSVWGLYFYTDGSTVSFTVKCVLIAKFNEIFVAEMPIEALLADEWHHIAVTSNAMGSAASEMDFYFDGQKVSNTTFNSSNYWMIRDIPYRWYLKTQPLYLGTSPALEGPFDESFIIAMDEVRLWKGVLGAEDVKNNFHKKVLQSDTLVGYWNFDDLRNRLGYISDLSYTNNTGRLKKGATFIPQYPQIQTTLDSIMYYSSNLLSDSVVYSFIDHDEHIVYADTLVLNSAGDTLLFDVSALPENISKLQISEYAPGSPDIGFVSNYNLKCLPPTPIATPKYNWNTFYYSSDNMGQFYNAFMVSGLAENTTKVELGLKKGDEYFNLEHSTKNSIPYQYSLTLNGSNNYIETSHNIEAPEKLTMSLWFKTTTKEGGKIIGFSDSRQGKSRANHDRELIMEKDGSLRFYLRTDDSTYILSADNKYNDGLWHDVAVVMDGGASLYLDGSLVDRSDQAQGGNYSGYWTIGRNGESKSLALDDETIAAYFQGTLCEIVITDKSSGNNEINANRYGLHEGRETKYHYKLNEGEGTVVNDSAGNNTATLKGSSQNWYVAASLSFVVWNHNIIDKVPGTYDFFARVFYIGGPTEGAFYPLGRINIKNPFPEHNFTYNMSNGFGYFNEGTELSNMFEFWINNTNSDTADWKNNFLKYKFFTPDRNIIDHDIFTYTGEENDGSMQIDMGDAPPGSYLSLEVGYHTNDDKQHVTNQLSFPLYFNPMLAPIVTGNFGPFNQAIAPGTMEHLNTFVITTEILSDLNKVKAKFYNKYNKELGETDAVQLNDTIWHITYDMAKLSPKTSKMKVEYYLGPDPHPALVQGPFTIHITSTRPKWFDFIPDTSFHNVLQSGDEVTFSIITPFEKSYLINNSESVDIPWFIPLIGGTNSNMKSPTAEAYLKYGISEYKLELDTSKSQKFFQKVFNLGAGNAETFRFGFNYAQHNTYSLDNKNNLLATQNFATGGSATSGFQKLENLAAKIKELIDGAKIADPETIIVSPDFSLTFTGQFEYSSRQNLIIDPVTGKWGSFGNLKVDANPDHDEAYKNSASFKFYSTSLGVEFSIGAELLEGLLAGYFGTDARFVLGFGHAYTTIPKNKSRHLKSFAFQTYGRFYITALWGWYERTYWGPKLFSSSILWGDDMSDAFPPLGKKSSSPSSIKANSSWTELTDEVKPVRKFTKMPMPVPEPNIVFSNNQQLFTWVERGKTYGERKLRARYLDNQSGTFANTLTIELNNHALNNPVADAIDKNLTFFCWAQTRHDNKSILKVRPDDALKEFVKSQDIWYAIYDQEKDSILVMTFIEDDSKSFTSGRAEANPVACVLTDERVMIAWQVADLDDHQSELWYVLLEESGGSWLANTPQFFVKIDGVATQLEIASPTSDEAIVTWLNTSKSDSGHNNVMTAVFDGSNWSAPKVLLDEIDEYYNYQSLNIENGQGGLVVTSFIEDLTKSHHEKVMLVLWDDANNQWQSGKPLKLLVDSVYHLQLPQMTINADGKAIIAIKAEKLVLKDVSMRISQVDLILGDLNDPQAYWKRIEANEYVCDTTKQLVDLQITYVDDNVLMLLSNEYPMLPTNSKFVPENGKMFGDQYMNLVLRSFAVDELGDLQDVDENDFFTAINEFPENKSKARLYQNYPNPCTDFTTITFDIPDNTKVNLELFDMTGNKVATLVEQQMSAGRYEINLNTSLLKSGTYIYRITTDGYSSALRMMVGN